MEVWIVQSILRQLNGEMVFVRTEKGFKDKNKAEEYAKSLSKSVIAEVPVPNVGNIKCACEVGIFKVEIEE